MKKKSLIITAVLTSVFTLQSYGQGNCDLINTVTLSATPNQSITQNVSVGYLTSNNLNVIDTNVWHYLVLTKTNNSGNFYIDGNLIYSGSFVSNPYIWNSLLFGATQGCVSCPAVPNYQGKIDEVRISNIARSANEIALSFNSNSEFIVDQNTIGLFHLETISNNTVSNSVTGTANVFGLPSLTQGKYGQCINFDGIDDYLRWTQTLPVNNLTLEFWYKSGDLNATIMMLEYAYNTGVYLGNSLITNQLNWSNGATGNSVTVDPNSMPYVWVTDGTCTDTVWFDQQSATIYDTVYTTVTDTLIINTSLSLPAPNNQNTILIYPNPASTHITIDYGNFAIMNGYQLSIENSLGQQVFQTFISQQSDYLSLATWGGNGLYFVHIIDAQGNTMDIRKIVIQ
jgi:hypothetical protein